MGVEIFTEFDQRWSKARISAFQGLYPNTTQDTTLGNASLEAELLTGFFFYSQEILPTKWDALKDSLLKGVFDSSRKLALSLSKRLGLSFEIQDFQNLLKQSGIPCAQGDWSSRPNARVLSRKGCEFCPETGALACDYWREALDGLVMGLGDKERLARHASIRHGDEVCIDVFFTESTRSEMEALAWGEIPEHMALDLFEIAAYFHQSTGVAIEIKGFREGVLFFEFASSTDLLCGNSHLLGQKFHGLVREKFPGLALKDVTPQAVLGTTTG